MRVSVLLLITCAILSSACQKDKKKGPALACGSDMSLNQNAPLRQDIFKLSREFEIVRNVDCNGREKISRVTVKDPKDAYLRKFRKVFTGLDLPV